eukprot:gene11827-13328_t
MLSWCYFLLLLATIVRNAVTSTTSTCFNPPQSEVDSLKDLYNSTHGASWLQSWNISSSDPCGTWFGVTCHVVGECHVTELTLENNNLVGSLPNSIGNLTKIELLSLFSNQLRGSIPSSIGNLAQLTDLELGSNQLTGTVPSSIANLVLLTDLRLYSNQLTGSIPSQVWQLPLSYLYLFDNHLNGSLSEDVCQVTSLTGLYLADNAFDGEIPSCLDRLSQLVALDLSANQFTASSSLRLPQSLLYLDVSSNRLHGTDVLESLLSLSVLYGDLSNNRFSGSLPPSVWNTSVQQLFLNGNRFTGSFPSRGDRDCSLQYLSVSDNLLTGALPLDLSLCVELTSFFASDMKLTGPVTGRFASQAQLQTVVIANNSLTGPLDDVFAGSQSAEGWILNAGYNAFTGTLPVATLSTGRYESLILLSNCLSGTLPVALCANTNMTQLLLSGLHASSACGLSPFPGLSVFGVEVSYLETNWVRGTIPACLLSGSLPALSFLALSGNLLTGTVSRTATVVSSLTGLDLSHNALTGSIPAAVVEAPLSLLDLSFNRLSGTIAGTATAAYATAGTTAQVSLAVNRLSGTLPGSWEQAVNIDVLKGNVFACTADSLARTAHLPIHDQLASTYACGSSPTNVALVVAVVTLVVAAVAYAACEVRSVGVRDAGYLGWAGLVACGEALRWRVVTWVSAVGWRGAAWMALYLAASLVVYAVTSVTTSAYAETYVWVVSMSLQEGSAAGSVLLVWVGVLCAMVLGSGEAADDGDGTIESATKGEEAAITSEHTEVAAVSSLAIFGACVSLLMVHILPVLVIDIAYVYSTTLSLSTAKRAMIVVAMSLYKMTWTALLGAGVGPIEGLFVRGGPNGCSSHSLVQRTLVYA